jgi:putative multicomponent Na+:H+ antiporter subunit B
MDNSVYWITALLPLTAAMVVSQKNPYHALLMRGILGAISALVYAVLGAADVALTEALVGSLLSVLLYAVAVRSSLVLRLGVLSLDAETSSEAWTSLQQSLFSCLRPYHLRLEVITYATEQELLQGLASQDIHASWQGQGPLLRTRLPRIQSLLQAQGLTAVLWETPPHVTPQELTP